MKAFFTLICLFFNLCFLEARADVWTATQEWSPAWEQAYSQWVKSEWNVDFFARKTLPNGQKNPYHGLRVDCADTVYSMRLIFAYENKLPFVVQDPTTTNATISNRMGRWDGKNEIERVRQFLYYIYNMMSTRSLANDTYPVAISNEAIRAGTLIKTTAKNHHSWTVKDILPIGVPWLVYNSVLGAGTSLTLKQRQSWPNPDWVFEGDATPAGTAGFRAFRNPEYINKPVWTVPGYSEEQYRIPLAQWNATLQKRLALRQETDSQLTSRLLKGICDGAVDRINSVNEGLQFLKTFKNKCMDYPNYDNFSTPSRDRRIFDDLISLRQAYKAIQLKNQGRDLDSNLKAQLNKIFPAILKTTSEEARLMVAQGNSQASLCAINYAPGKTIDLAEFKRRMFLGHLSNNPHDNLEQRWGEVSEPSNRAKNCPSWDVWTPDLETN